MGRRVSHAEEGVHGMCGCCSPILPTEQEKRDPKSEQQDKGSKKEPVLTR